MLRRTRLAWCCALTVSTAAPIARAQSYVDDLGAAPSPATATQATAAYPLVTSRRQPLRRPATTTPDWAAAGDLLPRYCMKNADPSTMIDFLANFHLTCSLGYQISRCAPSPRPATTDAAPTSQSLPPLPSSLHTVATGHTPEPAAKPLPLQHKTLWSQCTSRCHSAGPEMTSHPGLPAWSGAGFTVPPLLFRSVPVSRERVTAAVPSRTRGCVRGVMRSQASGSGGRRHATRPGRAWSRPTSVGLSPSRYGALTGPAGPGDPVTSTRGPHAAHQSTGMSRVPPAPGESTRLWARRVASLQLAGPTPPRRHRCDSRAWNDAGEPTP